MAKSSIDINGYRKQTANPISRTGVFPYYGKQIDFDGSLCLEPDRIYWVLRSEEELFNEEAMNSFNGIPIIVGHTMLGEGFASPEKRTPDGCIYNVRRSLDTPDQLIADFTIYTKRMQDILKAGKVRELSLGYRCQYVPDTGIYNGQAYEFKQVHLRGNHLALVEHGRCGSSVCVCDEALPITFDSLPEGIQNMDNQDEKKEAKKLVAGKLADVLKNGTEDDCQAILDFSDLSKEDKAKALAFIKGEKTEPKTPAQDAKAKDDVTPPPPPPPDVKKDEPKADATGAAATPAATPTSAEPKAEVPPTAPKADGTPAVEPKKEEPTGTPVAPTAEPPKAEGEDCKGKGKGTKDEIVHDKDCHDPECKGECIKKAEKEPKTPAADETSTVTQPTAQVPKAALQAEPKKEEPKAEVKEEPKKEEPKTPTADGGVEPKKEEPAKAEPPKAEPPKEEPKAEPPKTEEPKKEEPVKAEPPKAEPPKAEDAKAEPKATEEKKGEEVPKEEAKKGCACDSAEQYKAFAEEYSRAQKLADSVRPLMSETFDSATMREVDVARFAAKHIEALAFAADQADEVVLGAVHAHLNTIESMKGGAKPKTYQVAEDQTVTPAPKTTSARELVDFLGGAN